MSDPEREPLSLRWVLVVAVLAIVAFVLAMVVQRHLFPFFSGDHDEPVYRFQAEMLRDGNITLPIAQNEFFRPWLSGPHGDRLVMAFQPGWPAVLLVADVLTGSMLPALGFAAALTVIAGFAFAREVLRSVPRAVLAAAILSLSPFVLMLSGTYLNYVFALGLYLLFGALLLRGLRRDSVVLLLLAGLVIGFAFFTRPYDAVLFALPFAVWVAVTARHDPRRLARIAAWFALGVAPFLLLAFAYNVATAGNPLQFPTTTQSEGVSAFGWGVRSIAPDTPELNFTVVEAFESLGTNSWTLPTWLLGAYATLAFAVYGSLRLWRVDRGLTAVMIGLAAIFPIGYLAWWASSLTTNGALEGLGPHYYVPVLAPLAVLGAHGAAEAWARRRRLVVIGIGVAVVLTAFLVPPKIEEKHGVNAASRKIHREVEAGLRQRDGEPAILIQERRKSTYVMEPYPFLSNPPDLDADVLYARDRGARGIDLIERRPGRRVYRMVRQLEPGQELGQLPVVVKRQTVTKGPTIVAQSEITNTTGARTVTAYSRFGRRVERRLLTTDGTKGETFAVTWLLTPDGLEYTGPPARRMRPIRVQKAARRGVLVVGATFSRTPRAQDPDAVERWYYARIQRDGDGGVEVLTADEEWTRFGRPVHAWLPVAADGTLDVLIMPGGASP